jgi:hypothetical protein
MIAKTSCQHCGIHIEFEVENANQFVSCPSCGKQTRLLVPGANPGMKYFTVRPGNTPAKKKWGWKQWLIFLSVVVTVLVLVCILCKPAWRAEVLSTIGLAGAYLLGMAAAGGIAYLAYLLIASGIVLEFIIWALILIGLWLCFDGFFNRLTVGSSKDGTIFQQIYATVELVGGALVFCGAMILQVVRARLHPHTSDSSAQSEKATP